MQIDAGDVARFLAAGGGFGGMFAVVRPFADKLFTFWLRRLEERAAIEDGKEGAVMRIAVQHERMTGVLETINAKLDRVDARLDRIEAHHGISPSPSSVPAEPPPVETRRALTDPDLRVEGRPSLPSRPTGAPA